MLELMIHDALYRSEDASSGQTDSGNHIFNLSVLCCLPKKSSGSNAEVGARYEALATRPLAIVNTDNRIMASAARL